MLCSIFAPFDAKLGSLFRFSSPPINGTPFDSRSNVDNEHTYPTLSEYVLNTRKNSIIWLEVFAMLPISINGVTKIPTISLTNITKFSWKNSKNSCFTWLNRTVLFGVISNSSESSLSNTENSINTAKNDPQINSTNFVRIITVSLEKWLKYMFAFSVAKFTLLWNA
ncbi:hypothetical protein AYI70_g554 [Smittium culicis]|uniref:Uncharacterized protein n=1 Tax=Smittium culicis TaxID=133412 RepID=A0A1R1YG80_9FUNG|nr:hypothetical protein AYI70_g554 [Smittium culicis]